MLLVVSFHAKKRGWVPQISDSCERVRGVWVWVKMKPPGIGPQVLVLGSLYQGFLFYQGFILVHLPGIHFGVTLFLTTTAMWLHSPKGSIGPLSGWPGAFGGAEGQRHRRQGEDGAVGGFGGFVFDLLVEGGEIGWVLFLIFWWKAERFGWVLFLIFWWKAERLVGFCF